MNINDVITRRFVTAYDLQGKEPIVTIAKVVLESVGWGTRATQVPVLYFLHKDKGLKLGTTMLRAIAEFAGEETDRWIGVSVQLYTTTDRNPKNGLQVPVVRVKQPAKITKMMSREGTTPIDRAEDLPRRPQAVIPSGGRR